MIVNFSLRISAESSLKGLFCFPRLFIERLGVWGMFDPLGVRMDISRGSVSLFEFGKRWTVGPDVTE